jgi:hypothetical protein
MSGLFPAPSLAITLTNAQRWLSKKPVWPLPSGFVIFAALNACREVPRKTSEQSNIHDDVRNTTMSLDFSGQISNHILGADPIGNIVRPDGLIEPIKEQIIDPISPVRKLVQTECTFLIAVMLTHTTYEIEPFCRLIMVVFGHRQYTVSQHYVWVVIQSLLRPHYPATECADPIENAPFGERANGAEDQLPVNDPIYYRCNSDRKDDAYRHPVLHSLLRKYRNRLAAHVEISRSDSQSHIVDSRKLEPVR